MSSDSESQQVLEEPPRKRFKLFTSLPQPRRDLATQQAAEMETRKKKLKTAKCTNWAVNVLQEWREKRNKASPDDLIPYDLLERRYELDKGSVEPLVRWLSLFLVEARSRDGKPYTPLSLQGLLFGLLRYMRQHNPYAPNFMDKKDVRFRDLHTVLDNTFAILEEQRVGTPKKYVPLVTDIMPEQEKHLWNIGVLGTDSPLKLLRAVYFKMGNVFRIGGALKHRYLKPSLLRRDEKPDRYTYAKAGLKKNPVGFGSNKVTFYPVYYADPSAGERCLVHLLDLYLTKLPGFAYKNDVFYLRPKIEILSEDSPWYEPIPIGIEKLRVMGRDICAAAGMQPIPATNSVDESCSEGGQILQMSSDSPAHVVEISQVTFEELSPSTTDPEQLGEGSSHEEQEEEMEVSPVNSTSSCTCSDQSLHAELRPVPTVPLASGKLKREAEVHIYESDHHCVYIYTHRCKSRRAGRRSSCPPIFTADCGVQH